MNTKFNIGDVVWWVSGQQVVESIVGIIEIGEENHVSYRVYDNGSTEDVYYWLTENNLYATKEEANKHANMLKQPLHLSLGKVAYCVSPVYGYSAADGIVSYKVEKAVPIERKEAGVSVLVYIGQVLHVKYVSFNDLYDDEAMAMLEAASRTIRNNTNSSLRSYTTEVSRLIRDKAEKIWKNIFPEVKQP